MKNSIVADLKSPVKYFEQALSTKCVELEREKQKNQHLQLQVNKVTTALVNTIQDNSNMINQCQLVSNTNLALSEELRKAKTIVETLEAVILMLSQRK